MPPAVASVFATIGSAVTGGAATGSAATAIGATTTAAAVTTASQIYSARSQAKSAQSAAEGARADAAKQISDLKQSQAAAAGLAQNAIRRRVLSRTKSIYTSPLGIGGVASVARKTLLGE